MSSATVFAEPEMEEEDFQLSQISSVVPIKESWDSWTIDAVKKIFQFQFLPKNWDSYGGLAPSKIVIWTAAILVTKIMIDDSPRPRIVPVPGGGIQFEWRNGRRGLEIEVRPDGSVEYLKVENNAPIGEGEKLSSLTARNIETLLSWLIAG